MDGTVVIVVVAGGQQGETKERAHDARDKEKMIKGSFNSVLHIQAPWAISSRVLPFFTSQVC
jgi:hypothetical protein